MPPIPLSSQRWMVAMSSVHLQCLGEEGQPISGATASGFIRQEGTSLFLYTCWHVVTGCDPYSKTAPPKPPQRRRHIRVSLQAAESAGPGTTRIGGLQTHDIPLFEQADGKFLPLWFQDEQDVCNVELNALGYRVPFWHDAVKLQLPEELQTSNLQRVDNSRIFGAAGGMVLPGDKALIAGFPHGFSTVGPEQPTPVVLTRFVAATAIAGRHRQFLLESIGSAGMSGGPVYIEAGNDVLLVGMYTGLIYPDYLHRNPEKATALGTVTDLTFHLHDHLPFVRPTVP